jgi:serine/threonine protein phosphatase PrpC
MVRRTARSVVVDFAELSDPGRDPAKQVNEDSCGFEETSSGLLAVVCDGMGGHTGGRAASQTAVRAILQQVAAAPPTAAPDQVLGAAIEAAGTAVFAVGGDAPEDTRPGSTCAAALLTDSGLTVAHVGDSRVMLIRSGHLTRLTRDHSMVREMIDAGVLTEAEADHHPDANKITRALGMAPQVAVEVQPSVVGLLPNDVLLLTSDGVTDLVSDPELLAVVGSPPTLDPAAVCQELVRLGNARGGHDNLTVQVLRVLEVQQSRPAAAPTIAAAGSTVLIEGRGRLDATAAALLNGGAAGGERGPRPTLPDREHPPPTLRGDEAAGVPRPTLVDNGLAVKSGTARQSAQPHRQPSADGPSGSVLTAARGAGPARSGAAARRRGLVLAVAVVGVLLLLGLVLLWSGQLQAPPSGDDHPPPSAPPPPAVRAGSKGGVGRSQLAPDPKAASARPGEAADSNAQAGSSSTSSNNAPFP